VLNRSLVTPFAFCATFARAAAVLLFRFFDFDWALPQKGYQKLLLSRVTLLPRTEEAPCLPQPDAHSRADKLLSRRGFAF
jgi:hypothetical protein